MSLPEGVYRVTRKIRFGECDPAGMVFYPEFFRMFNDVFEDWMENAIGADMYDQLFARERRFPVVRVAVDFKQPRKLGDELEFVFILTGLGRSSIRYTIVARDARDETLECLRGDFVSCVASKETERSIEIPAELRPAMETYLESCRGISL